MKNGTLIIKEQNGIAIFKYPNLQTLLCTISYTGNCTLTNDGAFLWLCNNSYLRIWDIQGNKILESTGNYVNARVYIDSNNIYVANVESNCTYVNIFLTSMGFLISL
jgi:hypothetical protein